MTDTTLDTLRTRASKTPLLVLLQNPVAVAIATVAVLMTAVLLAILMKTGGTFTYTLDDPYIHLALAEQLRHGHYGINPDEFTSPSSSILWPFLLVPTAGTAIGPYTPLLLNAVFAVATAYFLGRFVAGLPLSSDTPRLGPIRGGLAVLLVLATNLVGLAFTGLEHNLQILIAVAVTVALVEYERGADLPDWAIAAAAIGPGVRYEMFAITAAVGLVLLFARDWRRLVALAAAALTIPVAFSMFLLANGNMVLPNSVLTKLTLGMPNGSGLELLTHLDPSTIVPRLLLIGMVGWLGWAAATSKGRSRAVLVAVAAIGVLHFAGGQFGWFFRYELYAMAACGLMALALLARIAPRFVPIFALFLAQAYIPPLIRTPGGAQNIYLQQHQMHRFVAKHYRKSFAVNDLGWVSIRLEPGVHVLDLWGLASNEALRQWDKSPEWLDDVTRRNNAGLAMIYRSWFQDIPATWTKVGDLTIDGPLYTAAAANVSFYATAVGDAAGIRHDLEQFREKLPQGTRLDLAPR